MFLKSGSSICVFFIVRLYCFPWFCKGEEYYTCMKNPYIKKYIEDHGLTVLQFDEQKPWWAYYILEETPEYDKKILWLKPHALLSLQYHGNPVHLWHREEGEALTDMAIVMGNEDVSQMPIDLIYEEMLNDLRIIPLKKWEKFRTPAGYLHAYVNPYDHDVYLLETRISQIPEQASDRESNITRIYDITMRDNVPNWPEWLQEKILSLKN